ncbi:Fe-S cluster assembly sulfur transfer protein SufU [Lactobacillus sp. Sy-1]|uniref:Fe-S cluster assembly sulfur transfer protein SufU n=1 Tax=Lactobacillus sp. Sy-1 TaxID=2109645 RepID=UPI001C5A664E|nr:SUF system NifU family Fe-S cluster assembly protein [Lactobacillus sp. Sy-1]MBW1606160.1 SUF system NifU family Fe-S cluster assembly protein [Lactobacillus sp. Sy-1]
MSLMKLNQLYRSVILDHANHPRNFGELATRTSDLVLRNPSCGDIINVQIQVEANQIRAIKFRGSGCTISNASASIMTTMVKGKSLAAARRIINLFLDNIVNKEIKEDEQDQLGDALLLSNVAKFPTRIRCATLSWHALADLIDEQEGVKIND